MILLTGDHQLSFKNLPRFRRVHDQMLRICERREVSAVVNLGDLKDAFNPVDVRIVNEAVDHIRAFRDKGIPYFLLLGNHDKTSVNEDSPNWFPTLRSAGAVCIDTPQVQKVGRVHMYCLPFSRDKDAQRKQLAAWARKTRRGGKHLLLFHDAVRGAWLNVHHQVESQDQSAFHVNDLNAMGYNYCIGGHLHLQHKLKPNVWYVGSPYPCDWGEVNQKKGFLLYDGETGKLLRIRSIVPGWYDPTLPDFEEPKTWKGASVRIHVPPDGAEINAARKKAEQTYKGASIVTVPIQDEEESVEVSFDPGANEATIIKKYIESVHPGKDLSYGKEAAAAYLLSVLGQVKQTKRNQQGVRFLEVEGEKVLSFGKVSCTFRDGIQMVTGINKDREERSNGSGKTSYLSLLAIALFGRSMKGQKHDRWVLRGSKGKAWVRLKFLLPDGRQGEIYRQRKPAKVQLFINGEEEAHQSMDLLITKITGLTWETMENAVYVDQRGVNLLLSGTDAQRKDMLASMLNLKRFEEARKIVRAELVKWQDYQEQRQEAAARAEREAEEAAEELANLKGEVDITTLRKEEKGILAKITSKKKEEEAASKKALSLMEELHEMEERLEGLQEQRQECRIKMESLQRSIKQAEKNTGTCPTCGQKLPEDKKLNSTLKKWKKELATWDKQLNGIFAEEEPVQQAYTEIEEQATEQQEIVSRTSNSLRQLEAVALADVRQRLAQEETKEQMRKPLREREEKFRNYFEIQTEAAGVARAEVKFLRFCTSVLNKDGLPVFLMGQILPRLSKLARYYSSLFSDGDISLQFSLEDEDVDVQVINETGGEFVGDQSQGEIRLASLICSFALRDLMNPCNILIADEPGEGLDESTARQFAKGLLECRRRFPTILTTTHNAYILSELADQEQTIITKEGGVSSVRIG